MSPPAPAAADPGAEIDPAALVRARLPLLVAIAGLSAFGPLTTDVYLPALPSIGDDLGASTTAVQLTLTACVIGLATGQVVAGPLSDAVGRRRPLLCGLALFVVASIGCAAAPSAVALDAMRVLQGVAGGAGIVVARAIVRDLFRGAAAARVYSLLAATVAMAPILAPLIGGQALIVTDWRGVFAGLAGAGAALALAAVLLVPETLPRDQRRGGSPRAIGRELRALIADRRFISLVVISAVAFGTLFAYISASSLVYQDVFGFSPQLYGALFGINGAGLLVGSLVNGRLVRRRAPAYLLWRGAQLLSASSVTVAVLAAAGVSRWWIIAVLPLCVASIGLVMPNAIALAMAQAGPRAGSGSALIGVLQFGLGAAVAPAVGVAGASAIPMGVVMAACALTVLAGAAGHPRPASPPPPAPSS